MGNFWAVLLPMYARYNTAAAVKKAFESNKDFQLRDPSNRWNGKPCNKHDLLKYSTYTHAELRYGDFGCEHVVVNLQREE